EPDRRLSGRRLGREGGRDLLRDRQSPDSGDLRADRPRGGLPLRSPRVGADPPLRQGTGALSGQDGSHPGAGRRGPAVPRPPARDRPPGRSDLRGASLAAEAVADPQADDQAAEGAPGSGGTPPRARRAVRPRVSGGAFSAWSFRETGDGNSLPGTTYGQLPVSPEIQSRTSWSPAWSTTLRPICGMATAGTLEFIR